MSDARRGLPLTKSHREEIFPKLTPVQISRIAAHGRTRSVQSGEVLIEQGDTSVPFFVVITGEVEILRGPRVVVKGFLQMTRNARIYTASAR
jgi:thioredoxin reductase (NADPH)